MPKYFMQIHQNSEVFTHEHAKASYKTTTTENGEEQTTLRDEATTQAPASQDGSRIPVEGNKISESVPIRASL